MTAAPSIQKLGRYEIVERLSSGGMGEVFLARFAGPGGFMKPVAVKRIHPHLANDESFVHMLHDEANLASMVRHPNIVATIDVGNDAGNHFLVLEYVPGDALGKVFRDLRRNSRSMPPWVAVWIGTNVASALAAAHSARSLTGEPLHIVHRDVSLSNILLSDLGHPMLFDFGVAKASQRIAQTTHGELKGKLCYMAPETFHGAEITDAVDIFSLGVVLYELLSGKSPFQRESDLDTIKALQSAEVPAPTGGREPELDAIVMRAMARDRAQRTPSAEVLSRELRVWALERMAPHDATSVATWYRSMFPERVEARQALLARVADERAPISQMRPLASSSAGWPASQSGPLRTPAPGPHSEVAAPPAEGTTPGVARSTVPVAPPPRKAGIWLAVAAFSAIAGAAVAVALFLSGRSTEASEELPPAAAVSAAPSPTMTATPAPTETPSAEPTSTSSASTSSAPRPVSKPKSPVAPKPGGTGKSRGPLVRSYD